MKERLEPSEVAAEPHTHPRRKIHTFFLFGLRKVAQILNTVFFTRHSSYTDPPRLLSFFSTEREDYSIFKTILNGGLLIGLKMKG